MKTNEYGGEFRNAANNNKLLGDEKNTTVNGALTFQLSDVTKITARILYTEDDDGPRPFALQRSSENNCYPGYRSNRYRRGADNNEYQYYCGVVKQPQYATQDVDGTPFLGVDREMTHMSLVLDTEIGGHDLSARLSHMTEDRITGADSDHFSGGAFRFNYLTFAPSVTPAQRLALYGQGNDLFNVTDLDEYEDTALELIISSPTDQKVRYLAGLFSYEYERYQTNYDLVKPASVDNNGDEITNDAVFGMVEVDVSDKLSVAFEGRYSEEEKTRFDIGANPISVSFDTFSPRAVFNYKATDDMMLYASYSEGTKPGGLNGTSGAAVGKPNYDEEEVEALELGVKTTLLDGRMTANLSAYSNDITKYQLTTPVQSAVGNSVNSIVTNQGDVEIKGLEFDMSLRASDNVRIGLNYAYTDAEIVKGCDEMQFTLTSGGFTMAPFDINDPSTWNRYAVSGDGGLTPSNDPDNRYQAGAGNCSLAGKQAPMTAEEQLGAYVQMDFPMAGGRVFYINADAAYESSKFVQVHNGLETGSSTLVGAQMGLRGDSWDIRLFGRNLTDEDSIAMGTRWFDLGQGSARIGSGLGIDNGSPRGPFVSFRKGRQIGLKISKSF